ncbi:hypothetical protein HY463_00910 [Candidatus Peregrinibacteria bacterium]|nr:hypothetical protein [Candidatus Peregrinibacteria bacterium]
MLILTRYIVLHELKPLRRFLSLDEIITGAKKVESGLATPIKVPKNIAGLEFYKVRLGKNNGARMIVFMMTQNSKIVPVLIRLKKDKIFGMNMAMNNPEVAKQISKNLDHIFEDIKSKAFEEFTT